MHKQNSATQIFEIIRFLNKHNKTKYIEYLSQRITKIRALALFYSLVNSVGKTLTGCQLFGIF